MCDYSCTDTVCVIDVEDCAVDANGDGEVDDCPSCAELVGCPPDNYPQDSADDWDVTCSWISYTDTNPVQTCEDMNCGTTYGSCCNRTECFVNYTGTGTGISQTACYEIYPEATQWNPELGCGDVGCGGFCTSCDQNPPNDEDLYEDCPSGQECCCGCCQGSGGDCPAICGTFGYHTSEGSARYYNSGNTNGTLYIYGSSTDNSDWIQLGDFTTQATGTAEGMRFRTNGTNCPNGNARCNFNDVFNYFNYYGDDTEIVLSVITETLGTFEYVALWSSLEEDSNGTNAKMPWTAWTSNQGGIIENDISGREWGLRGTDPEPIYEIRFREVVGEAGCNTGLTTEGFCGCCNFETEKPNCTTDGSQSPVGSCARDCEDIVCGEDPFCCEEEWDFTCANGAKELCFNPCVSPSTGDTTVRDHCECFVSACDECGDCIDTSYNWDCLCDEGCTDLPRDWPPTQDGGCCEFHDCN